MGTALITRLVVDHILLLVADRMRTVRAVMQLHLVVVVIIIIHRTNVWIRIWILIAFSFDIFVIILGLIHMFIEIWIEIVWHIKWILELY
jgi:hypothetical protein